MASSSRVGPGMTLEEFLRWPRIDRKPYLEFIDGRSMVKVSPQTKHSALTFDFCLALNQFASPTRLGRAFPELRCTFGGRSIIPDVVFLLEDHIQTDERGRLVDQLVLAPDIHIEIRSPEQTLKKTRAKLEHSAAHGCPLGWLIDPDHETIDVYRRGLPVERLPADGFLDAAPVLPGFRLAVAEVFGWLTHRQPAPNAPDRPGGEPR